MKRKIEILALTSALALSVLAVGCVRTISKEERISVGSDGTITKTEETKKTAPVK